MSKRFPGLSSQVKRSEKEWEIEETKKWKTKLIPLEGRMSNLRVLVAVANKNQDYIPIIKALLEQMPWLIEDLVFLKGRGK